ncbi:non-ribosomal peptide synthetase, partial [Paraburkholderia flava]|uniref:non-ribosomal peptide synthetase n=1 Tax=Paraburkholderia flava TaxID=2547393 RepID=UPI0010611931
WSASPSRYEPFAGVHELFSREALRHPSAVALVYGEAVLTYAELESRANRLAHFLIGRGVGPEVRVGIGVERSVEMVVGLLAILKAGGAYVPLDPEYPAERLAYMCEDSGIALLLTQHALRERFDAHVAGRCAVVELDTLDTSAEPSTLPAATVHPEQLAYVIYTSGSTGRPKGAANRHGALYNRLAWMQQAYGLDATDTVLQKTPFSFDVSVWEFFWPLMTGARLAVAAPGDHREPARLVELIDRHQVSTLHFVPPMLQAFVSSLDEETTCTSLRRVICSGEALPATLQDRTLERLPHVQLYNLYGPTEAAIDVTHWTCRAGDATVPIGRPIGNVTTHVLDASMNRVPVGVAGELYLGGAGLARGYLKRAALTAERFVPDPFITGSRLYRTGDLARWRTDGALEYLGRLDHQVKVRGFRIELGEIEAALQTLEGVGEAVVVTQMGPGGARLVGYVTARAGATLEPRTLETGLKAKLPEYMVPSVWVELEKLPLSPNGKVERRALPAPERAQEQEHEAPQGEVETALAQVWESVLRVERISRHANFFELGGDSILSLQIVERARRAGWKVTPRQLFERQTVSQLAGVVQRVQEQVAQNHTAQGEVPLLPIQAQFFEQVQQQRHHWNQAVLLRSSEAIDAQVLEQALHALINHHDALRLRFTQDAAGRWVQAYAQTETGTQTQPDLLWIREAKDAAQIEAHSEAAQRSLDLTKGPLLRAVLMRIEDGSTRLLLVIHHLVVDGVSWRILL